MIKNIINKIVYKRVTSIIKKKNKKFFLIGYKAKYDLDIRYYVNAYYVNDMGRLDTITYYFTKSSIFRVLIYLNKIINNKTTFQTIKDIGYINELCERKTIKALYNSGGIMEPVSYNIIYEDKKFILSEELKLIDKMYLADIKLDYTARNFDIIENL